MELKAFYDKTTNTLTYMLHNQSTKEALVVDPILNYDQSSSTYSFESIDELDLYISSNQLSLKLILETHAHADHITGAQELKKRYPDTKVAVGEHITQVQATFKKIYNFDKAFPVDGRQFDILMSEDKPLQMGSINIKTIHTPGHTPACNSYLIGPYLFTGDALFMPDFGVARCDFPGGDAKTLYQSITKKLFTLPDETITLTGHDYQPGGRDLAYQSTIGEHKKRNVHLNTETSEEAFVKFRTERDAKLTAPKLLLPSLGININGGHLPQPESNGIRYLKIPFQPKEKR